jgi:hypothetical protein
MITHCRCGRWAIADFQRPVDFAVTSGSCSSGEMVSFITAEQALLLDVLKDLAELLVVGSAGDQGVKVQIFFDVPSLVPGCEEFARTFNAFG